MRAITFNTPGGPEVLQLTEVPDPTPGSEFALAEAAAAHQYMEDNRNVGKIMLVVD